MRVGDLLPLLVGLVGAALTYVQTAHLRGWWPYGPETGRTDDKAAPKEKRRRTRIRGLRLALGVAGLVIAYLSAARIADVWPFSEARTQPTIENRGTASQVVRGGDCAAIQTAIDAAPTTGGSIVVRPGTYVCTRTLVIDRDDVTLRGSGPATVLKLGPRVNRPVLVVGQTSPITTRTRRRVRVSDFMVDGNKARQQFECHLSDACFGADVLRNNGVTLRTVEDVAIERVSVKNARSSGLVVERRARQVAVRDFMATASTFDGLTALETEDSQFASLNLHHNAGAGLSFDIGFNRNTIRDSVVAANDDVGIFMRDSADNTFSGLRVHDNGSFGVFLAQRDTDVSTPATRNTFNDIVVSGSGSNPMKGGHAIRVNDPSCVGNVVAGSRLTSNREGAISEARRGLVEVRNPAGP